MARLAMSLVYQKNIWRLKSLRQEFSMFKRKTIFDDGYQDYLVEGANFEGLDGIPCLMDFHNAEIPSKLTPFSKAKTCKQKNGYIHFYEHDINFYRILTSTKNYIDLLKQFDGVITPDPSIIIGKSRCLHATSTYMNRAVGYYLQKNGIPVIANVRWGDKSTYDFAFSGIPKHSIVCVSTHGAIKKDASNNNYLRHCFKDGLKEMLNRIEPITVLVYGYMPNDIFGDFIDKYNFKRFPSDFETSHNGKEAYNGHKL